MSLTTTTPSASASIASSAEELCDRFASSLVRRVPFGGEEQDDDEGEARRRLRGAGGPRVVLSLAGAGNHGPSSVASTPGASSVLLEGLVLYDRRAFSRFVSTHPAPPPLLRVPTTTSTSASTTTASSDGGEEVLPLPLPLLPSNGGDRFSFSSRRAAALLANASVHRSYELTPHLDGRSGCVGVGCAGRLVSTPPSSSSGVDEPSEVHVAVLGGAGGGRDGDGGGTGGAYYDLTLSSRPRRPDRGTNHGSRRSRKEEDRVSSAVVLLGLLESCDLDGNGEARRAVETHLLDMDGGDSLTVEQFRLDDGGDGESESSSCRRPVEAAAARVVSGSAEAALLVPTGGGGGGEGTGGGNGGSVATRLTPLLHPVLPPDPLIFPGSFNPPHAGHAALASAASEAMHRKRTSESTTIEADRTRLARREADGDDRARVVEEAWASTEYHARKVRPPVLFEMSLVNPDKPSVPPSEAARRVDLFPGMSSRGVVAGTEPPRMPDDWGVLLTSTPLFVEKARLFGDLLPPTAPHAAALPSSAGGGGSSRKRRMTFVIGTDTLVRILNPKYYGGTTEGMLEAVREMGDAGVHFVVGGREEQGGGGADGDDDDDDGEGNHRRWVSGAEELEGLPDDVRDMFTLVTEEDFRVDVSSTELRREESERSGEDAASAASSANSSD